jgi:hypothetical protein
MVGIKNINNLVINRVNFKEDKVATTSSNSNNQHNVADSLFNNTSNNLSIPQDETKSYNIKDIATMAIDFHDNSLQLTEDQIIQELLKADSSLQAAKTGMEIDDIKNEVKKIEKEIYQIGGNVQENYVKLLKDAGIAKSKLNNQPIPGSHFASMLDRAFIEVF